VTDHEDDVTTAFMESVLMDEMHDYVQRGRRFENIATGKLNVQWAAAFRKFVRGAVTSFTTNRPSGQDTRELDDSAAELHLRELDLPIETVEREAGALQKLVSALGPDMTDEEIERFFAFQRRRIN
jgi:HAMP domain-containing protein